MLGWVMIKALSPDQRGLFTSTDPVFGGNRTSYGYPNDPVNSSDISGLKRVIVMLRPR